MSIDIKSLRRGNLIRFADRDVDIIDAIHRDFVLLENYAGEWSVEISPIELSSDLLIALGLEEDRVSWSFKDVSIYPLLTSQTFTYGHGTELKYLHQLQNLVYALTNEELPIDIDKIKTVLK